MFYMLKKWKKMEPALNLLAADDHRTVCQTYPNNDDRNKINVSYHFILLILLLFSL